MNDFVPILRADRSREMIEYERRGYVFRLGENQYIYARNISVKKPDEKEYSFEVRVTHSETRFYMISEDSKINESCVYLTIYELYQLLLGMTKKISVETITNILQSKRDSIWKIHYTGLKFDLKFFSTEIPKGKVRIFDSNIEVTYETLFLLLALIQDKSNYYWSIKPTEDKMLYVDGLLRLLVALINVDGHPILRSHKWEYNFRKKVYEKPKEKYDFKYYLTQDELKNIMEVKS